MAENWRSLLLLRRKRIGFLLYYCAAARLHERWHAVQENTSGSGFGSAKKFPVPVKINAPPPYRVCRRFTTLHSGIRQRKPIGFSKLLPPCTFFLPSISARWTDEDFLRVSVEFKEQERIFLSITNQLASVSGIKKRPASCVTEESRKNTSSSIFKRKKWLCTQTYENRWLCKSGDRFIQVRNVDISCGLRNVTNRQARANRLSTQLGTSGGDMAGTVPDSRGASVHSPTSGPAEFPVTGLAGKECPVGGPLCRAGAATTRPDRDLEETWRLDFLPPSRRPRKL